MVLLPATPYVANDSYYCFCY